jgi:hypothetical protein
MPCRDYDYDSASYSTSYSNSQLVKQNDRLARIACKAMTALAELGKEDFLILKDDEVREWWEKHQAADRLAQREAELLKQLDEIKKQQEKLK